MLLYIFTFKYIWQIKMIHMLVKKLSWMLILVNSTNTNILSVNKNTKKKEKKISIYFYSLLINFNSNNNFLLNKTCFSLLKKMGHIPL